VEAATLAGQTRRKVLDLSFLLKVLGRKSLARFSKWNSYLSLSKTLISKEISKLSSSSNIGRLFFSPL